MPESTHTTRGLLTVDDIRTDVEVCLDVTDEEVLLEASGDDE
jgi:hypothetical protein